jgi:hypothetical protein
MFGLTECQIIGMYVQCIYSIVQKNWDYKFITKPITNQKLKLLSADMITHPIRSIFNRASDRFLTITVYCSLWDNLQLHTMMVYLFLTTVRTGKVLV